ncbi:facilitated trehalose transporter Tret1-like [Anopheles nili]|uniref:facilitated trehalose transporter Tret1-like n=1 Tax=Anopheles nili TaxID=185578 RepID=UPI00237A67F1|nr:facilitated trehalose transporter Tret1-like [Anopheles nili]
MARVSVLRQYMASVLVNLLGVSYGTISGWTSSALPMLQGSTENPLAYGAITMHQASWIGGMLCLGGIVGTFVGGAIVERLGRKWTAWIAGWPLVACWGMIIVANHPGYLMAARFLGGLSGGIDFVVTPLYVAEIASTSHRGALSSILMLSCCVGVVIAYVAGAFLHYYVIPWVCITVPVFFLITFCFLPESPSYLAKVHQLQAAESSLRYFRGIQSEKDAVTVEEYVRELRHLHQTPTGSTASKESSQLAWSDFATWHSRRAFVICGALMALNQFCGNFYLLNYAQSMFDESGSGLSLPASHSVIVVGLIQLAGCYVCTLIVDRAGRKILLVISSTGMALGQSVFAVYCYGKELGHDLSSFGWLPLVCFSVVIFVGTLGVGTLPFVVLAEIMPQKIKGFATTSCMAANWALAFVALKYFSTLGILLGMHGILMFFALCSLSGALFVMLVMPETKGKTFQEIQQMMQQ